MLFLKQSILPGGILLLNIYKEILFCSVDIKASVILGILSKNLIRQQLDFWGYKTITKSRKKYDFYCCLLSP